MKKIFLQLLILSCTAFAQITITGNDVLNIFAVGNSTTLHQDTLQSTVDIGTPGGGNNWDFTSLQSNLTVDIMSVDPVTTPYASNFTGADFCIYTISFNQGFQAEIWTYSSVNGFVDDMGSATTTSVFPGFVITLENDPDRHTFQNPTTFGDQWMQTYTQTIYFNGTPFLTSSVSISVIVDAYGTMLLPGGAAFEALRIRETMTVDGLVTTASYNFLTKSGARVNVPAVSSNPPTSGVIDAESTSYNLAIISSVEQIDAVPQEYGLSQNYPNPFNPTTKIEYTIPEASFVQLKVYDILGNEVATLVNEEQSAGTFRADFRADNLASGLYIAKLQAGNYTKTIKMSLLK